MEAKVKRLGIDGKTVDITNIADKTKAQFAAQLKKAGVVIDDDRLERVYTNLHNAAVDERETAEMTDEQKREYFDAKYPEQAAKRARLEAEAKAKADAARAAAKAKADAVVNKVLAEKQGK